MSLFLLPAAQLLAMLPLGIACAAAGYVLRSCCSEVGSASLWSSFWLTTFSGAMSVRWIVLLCGQALADNIFRSYVSEVGSQALAGYVLSIYVIKVSGATLWSYSG